MATNITKQKSRRINGFSHHEIGDDHLYTGLDTPLKKDAFTISDAEKKNKSATNDPMRKLINRNNGNGALYA